MQGGFFIVPHLDFAVSFERPLSNYVASYGKQGVLMTDSNPDLHRKHSMKNVYMYI